MPEMQGLIAQEFTVEAFAAYALNVIKPALKAHGWTPLGAVLHNTGRIPNWDKITPAQHVKNMSVDWVARNFIGGPHFLITPHGTIMAVWPAWLRGTHSPSFNHNYWGIEMVGDFSLDPFPDVMRVAAVALLKNLYDDVLGKTPTDANFHLHKEDPRTTHKQCPGINCGDKQAWLFRVLTPQPKVVAQAVAPAKPQGLLATTSDTIVPWGTSELIQGFEAFRDTAYPDGFNVDKTPRFAVGWGTNIYPNGTPVKAGDTCTREQADAWLEAHILATAMSVQKLASPLPPGVLKSFISFVYEEGLGNFSRSDMLVKYNKGDYVGAATDFLSWDKRRDANRNLVVSPGIHARRVKELALWDVVVNNPAPPAAPLPPPVVAANSSPPAAVSGTTQEDTNMPDNKPWYQSQTVLGALTAMGGGGAAIWQGYIGHDTGLMLTGATSFWGGLTALIGRFKATKAIGVAAK